MIELLEKIETILTDAEAPLMVESPEINEVGSSHPLTSWTSDRILKALRKQLPAPRGHREKESLEALFNGRYSRCKIYPQLIEDSYFIKAIAYFCNIPKAIESCSSALPAVFNECADAILKAHDQTIASMAEDESVSSQARAHATQTKERAVTQLEKLAIDVFAKGLGDDGDQ